MKSIVHTGEFILGTRQLALDGIEIPLTLDQGPDSKSCRLRRGFEILELATAVERASLPVFVTWGYNVIRVRANISLMEIFMDSSADLPRSLKKFSRIRSNATTVSLSE